MNSVLSIRPWVLGIVALTLFSLAGCKSGKTTQGDDRNIPNRRTSEIIDLVQTNDLACDWLSIKYEVEIKTDKVDDSFKLYARLRTDSVIWISATYYAVEVARFLFTPDSVKMIDRKNNKYYRGNYDYITDRFMIDADFTTLQSLILGNASDFINEEGARIKSAKDDGNYFLSFLSKNQFRRALKKDEPKKSLNLVVSLWLDPERFRLSKASIVDFEDNRSLTATYGSYKPHCNSLFPYESTFLAESANEQAKVKTSVIKLTADKKVSVSFTIPEKYESLVP